MPDHEGQDIRRPDLEGPAVDADPTDPGGWGARFIGSLNLELGHLRDSQDATTNELRLLRKEARQAPALVKISSVFTLNTAAGQTMCQQGGSGAGVLIGGPEIGQQWSIRQIVVMGTTLAATPTGRAFFLVSAAPPNEQSPTSVVDIASALPSIAFYSPEQFYLAPNENLYMVIVGGTNAAQYVCSVALQQTSFVPRATETTV